MQHDRIMNRVVCLSMDSFSSADSLISFLYGVVIILSIGFTRDLLYELRHEHNKADSE